LTEVEGGLRLLVKATPKARRNEIGGVRDGRLLVKVTAAPEAGKANAAVIKLLSKAWRIPASAFELISGATSREKAFLIRGAGPEQVKL
jgi:uncharacterized protein (TIGR00251 family)